jgi:hypothetical protein
VCHFRVTLYPLHNPVFIPRTFFWPSEIGRRKGRKDSTIMVMMLNSCCCICWSSASKVDYKRWLPRDSHNSVETVVAVIGEVEWGKKIDHLMNHLVHFQETQKKTHTHYSFAK